jgi:hypothetical protein
MFSSFFAKSPALLALAVFILAHHCAIVWSAEFFRLGFAGATATLLAGSIAAEQKLFDFYDVNNVDVPRATTASASAQ